MSSVNAPNMHSQSYPPQHLMEFNNDFLLTQIKNQVEFYFAPQNLPNDKFLQSQLNATDHLGAVSINVICSFRKIRQLYSYSRSGYYPHDVDMPADPALLRMALATSSVVSISHDGMWIVPNVQKDPQKDSVTEATVASVPSSPSSSQDGSFQDRSTVILRDIAETVTEAMILETFAKFNPKAARSEAGDTWQLVFGSPEDAAASLEAGVKLDGKPIQGSLKADMPNVPALPLPPPAPQPPVMSNPNVMGYHGQYPIHPPPQYNYVPVQYGMPQMVPQYPMQPQYYPQPQYRYFTPSGQQRQQGGPPPQNVFVRPANDNNRMKRRNTGNKRRNRRQQQQQQQQQQNQQQQHEDNKNSRKDTNKEMNKNKKNQEKKEEVVKELDLSNEHFPSLGGKETLKPKSTKVTGYAQALKKMTKNTEPVEQALRDMTVRDETN